MAPEVLRDEPYNEKVGMFLNGAWLSDISFQCSLGGLGMSRALKLSCHCDLAFP